MLYIYKMSDTVEEPNVTENIEDAEPVVTTEEAEVTEVAEEPVVSNEEPVVSNEESVVSNEVAEEPVVSNEEPVVSTEEAEVAEEPVVSNEEAEVAEEPVVSSPEPSAPAPAPVEQVVSDIRDILADVPAPTVSEESSLESSDSSDRPKDLKQRIAELDYLRELCGKWSNGEIVKKQFLPLWDNKSITTNSDVNYEDTLVQLEKMPELIKLWNSKAINFKTNNYFKNIETYNLEKSLFSEDQSEEQKVEVLEQLVTLLTDCVNKKYKKNKKDFYNFIDNLY
jgi:hypothetical protein